MIFKRELRRAAATALAAVAVMAGVAACGGGSDTSSNASGSGPETTSLKIGVIKIAGVTPIFAAQKLGYFKDEGLDVTLETSSGGAQSLPLLSQGDLQITNAPAVSVILGRAHGYDFTILPPSLDAEAHAPGQTAVLASKASGVKSLADLAGKKVGVNTIKSVNWLYNRQLLKQAGVDLSTVTYVELPFPSMIDAVTKGSVDAIDVPQPFLYIAQQTGKVNTLGYTFLDVQPSVPITGYAASQAWMNKNPKTVAAFERAMTKAVDYMRSHEAEAKQLIVEYTGAKADLVDQIPLNKWSTTTNPAQIQKTADLMLQAGMINKKIDVTKFIAKTD